MTENTAVSETNYDSIFGRVALDQKLCTEEELLKCQQELKSRAGEEPTTIEDLMVQRGYVTKSQAQRVRESLKESKDAANNVPGYKILGKLGSGAMAIVYKAKQLSLDRTVAIKILPKRFTEKPDYIKRFYKEGKLAAKMNHNNIVQAIDVGEAGGLYYFVMEYVEGKTLYDDLAKGKVFNEQEALEMIIQLAKALGHAHAQGLIHRDVKPKNIMINTDNVVKLADMGLARATSDAEAAKSEAGKAFGTPYYIAPEQVRGQVNIDGRADIYALGATLYHMITGKVPFDGSSPSEVMKKHIKEDLVPPDHINTALSAGIAEVVEVMMAKNKNDRYKDMEELLVDLEEVKKGNPPVLARQKFNMSELQELGAGDVVYEDNDYSEARSYGEEVITRYRVGVVVLGAISLLLFIVVIVLLSK